MIAFCFFHRLHISSKALSEIKLHTLTLRLLLRVSLPSQGARHLHVLNRETKIIVPDRIVRDLLRQVRLEHLEMLIESFDTPYAQEWSKLLSPGEQQRLVFTRILYKRPQFAGKFWFWSIWIVFYWSNNIYFSSRWSHECDGRRYRNAFVSVAGQHWYHDDQRQSSSKRRRIPQANCNLGRCGRIHCTAINNRWCNNKQIHAILRIIYKRSRDLLFPFLHFLYLCVYMSATKEEWKEERKKKKKQNRDAPGWGWGCP